jgi:hypothetical protein
LNRIDGVSARRVWYQYWDTHLTIAGSYLARLKYVHENPVHHRIVDRAANYRWCSADWFERNASSAFYRALRGIRTDQVNIVDDFQSD